MNAKLHKGAVAMFTAAFLASLLICVIYYNYRMSQVVATISLSDETYLSSEEILAEITYLVQVSGEVNNPGVFEVAPGTRVMDMLELAGGASSNADLHRLNLVSMVRDGQRINVSKVSDAHEQTDTLEHNGDTERININTATHEELLRLPGIGPQTASNITAFRRAHGPFESIEGIMNVHGIGEGIFARISVFITVDSETEE